MDTLALLLSLFGFLACLAVLTNKARARVHYDKELQPNCLLTRWPLLFVTGPRSFFYFSNYWNIYPSYLAEHGYEVFHLRLPWSNSLLRQSRAIEFLKAQDAAKLRFHLVMDSATLQEFQTILKDLRPECIISITEITDSENKSQTNSLRAPVVPQETIEALPSRQGSFFIKWAYQLHRLILPGRPLSSLSALGAVEETQLQNARLLLERAQSLAEMDLREDL
ncbi:hypothetical protein B9G69_015635 [Bdellovibrio sp. SKB1291214]|uniref:hypothetical protein n=1 Tax=Bdellovibrio sp. SKB1291214 TaxID=1732569 RepID=UPI000B516B83|nr:hypothetical protein [Bdellovibrio sp. SKB1291214]UYL08475.1 hypothetical protein B9G69_015635 [Bdellovibrio sp. SKB1291214]